MYYDYLNSVTVLVLCAINIFGKQNHTSKARLADQLCHSLQLQIIDAFYDT